MKPLENRANPDLDFLSVQGHKRVLTTLKRGGRAEPYPSLVFGGPARIGKRLCAIWYSAFLNCLQADDSGPCGTCSSCHKIQNGIHPDLHFTRVPEKKTVIGVSEVREAVHELHHAPFEGRFRIWILEEGERLSDEAQNALLKTLEEPPQRAMILLVTNLEGSLIPTVSSRCRLVRFQALSSQEIEGALGTLGVDAQSAQNLASTCGGSYGSALSLFRTPKSLEEREAILDLFASLPGKGLWESMEISQELERMKANGLDAVLELGLSYFRDLLVLSAGSTGLVVHQSKMASLEHLAGQMSSAAIKNVLDEIREADHFLHRNVSPKLLLQRLCIQISKAV